tara:strand:+ start:7077 stop:8570 length:1494 start_codon:yes stop_codon:yes gene_type:complete
MLGLGLNLKPRKSGGGGGGGGGTDPNTTLFVASALSAGVTLTPEDVTRINNFNLALTSSGERANIDFITIHGLLGTGYTEAQRKLVSNIDVFDTTKTQVLTGDYAGAHISGVGYKSNGSFFIENQFNSGLSAKYSQNSATIGLLTIDRNTSPGTHDLSSFNSGFSSGILSKQTYSGDSTFYLNTGGASYSYNYMLSNSRSWWRSVRTASNVTTTYINGTPMNLSSQSSNAPINQKLGIFGAYNGAPVGGFYSSNAINGAIYGGNSSINGNLVEELINTHIFQPMATQSYLNKNLYIQSDSIMSGQALGNHSETMNKTITDLNANWTGTNRGLVNDQAANVDTNFATLVTPYFRSYYTKNIFYIALGTNDIVSGGLTAAQVYTLIKSISTKATALGFKVIISGLIARVVGGGGQTNFDVQRAALNSLFLADFTQSTGISNYTTSNSVTYAVGYLDLYANAKFATATNLTYFQSDNIHLSVTGSQAVSTDFLNSILPTL